jgi:hypothetical protein
MSGNTLNAVAGSLDVREGLLMKDGNKRIRYIGPEPMRIPAGFYCVRKEWKRANTQIGLFKSLDMAANCAAHNPEYSVFDSFGSLVCPDAWKLETDQE